MAEEQEIGLQCTCCGSHDGDPYSILSNGYCIPCDLDARIASGLMVTGNERFPPEGVV